MRDSADGWRQTSFWLLCVALAALSIDRSRDAQFELHHHSCQILVRIHFPSSFHHGAAGRASTIIGRRNPDRIAISAIA